MIEIRIMGSSEEIRNAGDKGSGGNVPNQTVLSDNE